MVCTDTFSKFGRRIASTQGCPYIVIAETPNPIQDLAPDALRMRAEAMITTVIDGLTLPPAEIERRLADTVRQQIRPQGIVRSGTPV
ncbi:MAG TPA: hypothetical protein VGQ54_05675 [Burkholderiales bacterium]|jgi:hypothetical protein|nr:hypothetical protein [Burkholderiales bacterium]